MEEEVSQATYEALCALEAWIITFLFLLSPRIRNINLQLEYLLYISCIFFELAKVMLSDTM